MSAEKTAWEKAESISAHRLMTVTALETGAGFMARFASDEGLRCYGQTLVNHGDGTFSLLIKPNGSIPSEPEARDILMPEVPFREEITVTVQAIYDCSAADSQSAQAQAIHTDLLRLLDADSTTGVACCGVTVQHLAPEAETYGNVEARQTAERLSDRMGDALFALYDECEGDALSLLKNALSDLRHFADQHGLSFDLADKSGFKIYRAEKDADNRHAQETEA